MVDQDFECQSQAAPSHCKRSPQDYTMPIWKRSNLVLAPVLPGHGPRERQGSPWLHRRGPNKLHAHFFSEPLLLDSDADGTVLLHPAEMAHTVSMRGRLHVVRDS